MWSGMGNEASYIVSPRVDAGDAGPTELAAALDEVRRAGGRVQEVTGPTEAPSRATFAATRELVEALRGRYADSLVIEPDAPLELY